MDTRTVAGGSLFIAAHGDATRAEGYVRLLDPAFQAEGPVRCVNVVGSAALIAGDLNEPRGPVTGYRVYVGTAPRTPGAPFGGGSTPYDLGATLTATPLPGENPGCTPFAPVTSYAQVGNVADLAVLHDGRPDLPH